MKRLAVLFLVLILSAAAADNSGMLFSIAIEEDWQGRVGKAGEIGPYQMLPGTRADRRRDLRRRGILNPTERQLAEEHLEWIRRGLHAAEVDPSPFNLALCWNAGVRATVTGRAPESSYRYAGRVAGYYENQRAKP